MRRRDFLKVSAATAAATCVVPLGLNTPIIKANPDKKPDKVSGSVSGWRHFEFMFGDGPDAKYRCKLCRGTFWVDACTEENLRLHRMPGKDYAELVPECEWCKLHEAYGLPVVPSHWGRIRSYFRKLHKDGGDDKYLFDWLDSAIEGYVHSRWSEYKDHGKFVSQTNMREVILPYENRVVCFHPEGKEITWPSGSSCRCKWGWGRMFLTREIEFPPRSDPHKFEPFAVYDFRPHCCTRYESV